MSIIKYSNFNKKRVLDIHGWGSDPKSEFHPWLKKELTKMGYIIDCPKLPNTDEPIVEDQVQYILDNFNHKYDIILGHSLGGCVSMKILSKLDYKIEKLILVATCVYIDPNQFEGEEEITKNLSDWRFNFSKIRSNCKEIVILQPLIDTIITKNQTLQLEKSLRKKAKYFSSTEDHCCGDIEPEILKYFI